jgi:hypothetical protein
LVWLFLVRLFQLITCFDRIFVMVGHRLHLTHSVAPNLHSLAQISITWYTQSTSSNYSTRVAQHRPDSRLPNPFHRKRCTSYCNDKHAKVHQRHTLSTPNTHKYPTLSPHTVISPASHSVQPRPLAQQALQHT